MSKDPFTSADFDNDWAKERQFMELRTEEIMKPPRRRPSYFRENEPGEELQEVIRENVESSRNH